MHLITGFGSKQKTRVWEIYPQGVVHCATKQLWAMQLQAYKPRHITLQYCTLWVIGSTPPLSPCATCDRSLNAPPRKYNEAYHIRAHIPPQICLCTAILWTNGWTDRNKERFRSYPPGESTDAHVPKGFFGVDIWFSSSVKFFFLNFLKWYLKVSENSK
jgi:hypothetical protein